MKSLSPPDKLKQAWDVWIARLGPFKEQTGAREEKAGPYVFVFVTCRFERDSIEIKLVYDSDKHIAGMGFLPVYEPPPYVRPGSFTEQEVRVGSGEWVLPGTLTVPAGAGPFSAVVLIHGSGPNDRDESIGPNKPFRDIARGLATNGIAVLRYDKRSKVYQGKMASIRANFTVKDETIDDALSAVALLRQTPGINHRRIFILGHSLGGMLLPRIAAEDNRIAGLVIVAGSTRPIERIVVDQLNYLVSLGGPEAEANEARLAKIQAQLERLKDPKLPETEIVVGAPPSYWRDMHAYNPGLEDHWD